MSHIKAKEITTTTSFTFIALIIHEITAIESAIRSYEFKTQYKTLVEY